MRSPPALLPLSEFSPEFLSMACFQNANGCHFVRNGAAPSTKSPPSPVSSPPGRGFFLATFSGIGLRHSLIQSRVFLKALGACLPLLGGEGRGEDGRLTNFINDIGADLYPNIDFENTP